MAQDTEHDGRDYDVSELTAELITDGQLPSEVRVSPDGRWVAFVTTPVGRKGEDQVSAVWVAPADGSAPARRLTAGTSADRGPQWTEGSDELYFLSDRVQREESRKPQVHRIRLDGGEAEPLTTWRSGVRGFAPYAGNVVFWAEDEPTDEDERREKERDDARVWGERLAYARLRFLDVESREIKTVDALGDLHVVGAVPRPGGGPLAVFTTPTPDYDDQSYLGEIRLVDPIAAAVSPPVSARADFDPTAAWWRTDDRWHLSYIATTPPTTIGGNAVIDLLPPEGENGKWGEERNLTEGLLACPIALTQVTEGPPLALVAERLDTAVYRLDETAGPTRLSGVDGFAASLSASGDGRVVAFVASSSYEPRDVVAGPPDGPFRRISDTRPELRGIAWGHQERLSYKASDGLEINGLLVLPVGKTREDGPFPMVTVPHGGPYGRHADQLQLSWYDCGQWLANVGYAVFLPNYRGGLGRGHDFATKALGAMGVGDWTDILTGIDLLVDEGVADADRLGIGGGSQGGFLSAWAIGQTDRFKAAVMVAGISDWGMMPATNAMPTYEVDLMAGTATWDGVGPHHADSLSPISFAGKVSTPVLILHGENDEICPLSQGEFFARAMRHFGVEHEYVVYPREPHSILERNHQLDVLRRSLAWLDRWLR